MQGINYNPLIGRIREKGMTQKDFAKMIGISESHLSRKLSGEFDFRQEEMQKICEVLHIKAADIGKYFFSAKS